MVLTVHSSFAQIPISLFSICTKINLLDCRFFLKKIYNAWISRATVNQMECYENWRNKPRLTWQNACSLFHSGSVPNFMTNIIIFFFQSPYNYSLKQSSSIALPSKCLCRWNSHIYLGGWWIGLLSGGDIGESDIFGQCKQFDDVTEAVHALISFKVLQHNVTVTNFTPSFLPPWKFHIQWLWITRYGV